MVGYMEELALQPLISHKAGRHPPPDLSAQVLDHVARTAASRAVARCDFSVSIADPSQPDMPLVAVSAAFEAMTGAELVFSPYTSLYIFLVGVESLVESLYILYTHIYISHTD